MLEFINILCVLILGVDNVCRWFKSNRMIRIEYWVLISNKKDIGIILFIWVCIYLDLSIGVWGYD